MMSAQDLTLNIAVNLGRIVRWAMDGRQKRIKQFLAETNQYMIQLEAVEKHECFQHTFDKFKEKFDVLKKNVSLDEDWIEEILTWANILTHRAKLA